jgi:uncharacterized protein (TIGR00369 family)
MESLPLENPFLQHLGIRLVGWSDGNAEFHLPMRHELTNRIGQVQGGVLCAMLDVAAGYSGIWSAPGEPARNAVTLSLTTNFMDVAAGEVLIARGKLQRRGRTIFFSDANVSMDGTRVLATAIGSFKYVDRSTPKVTRPADVLPGDAVREPAYDRRRDHHDRQHDSPRMHQCLEPVDGERALGK